MCRRGVKPKSIHLTILGNIWSDGCGADTVIAPGSCSRPSNCPLSLVRIKRLGLALPSYVLVGTRVKYSLSALDMSKCSRSCAIGKASERYSRGTQANNIAGILKGGTRAKVHAQTRNGMSTRQSTCLQGLATNLLTPIVVCGTYCRQQSPPTCMSSRPALQLLPPLPLHFLLFQPPVSCAIRSEQEAWILHEMHMQCWPPKLAPRPLPSSAWRRTRCAAPAPPFGQQRHRRPGRCSSWRRPGSSCAR